MIDTTVHIDVELYETLSREAERLMVSRVRLISSLLGHMSRRQRDYARVDPGEVPGAAGEGPVATSACCIAGGRV